MNEQNRQRLERMTRRFASRVAQGDGEAASDAAFLSEFARTRDEVLRPLMDEVGAQLRTEGYESRVATGGPETSPMVEFHVAIPGRDDSKDTVRFFAHKDTQRGWQVIAEIELKRSPMELARFDAGDPITREVAEQLMVDATEQVFASALAAPRGERPTQTAPSVPKPSPRPEADAGPLDDAATGVRALVLQRLRAGRLLHGLDLIGADLHGIDFTGAMMPGLDLRNANLRDCVLVGARLTAAILAGADLMGADLTRADLVRADLSGAVLERARLEGAKVDATLGMPSAPSEGFAAGEPEPPPAVPSAAPVHTGVAAVDRLPELALPSLPDAPEARWARWAGVQRMGETEEVDVSAFRSVALPFAAGPPTPGFFAAADAARAKPRAAPRVDDGYETMVLPVVAPPPARGEDGAVDDGVTGPAALTLEQYAAFCAELTVFAPHAGAVQRRYGLEHAQRRVELEEGFARRFREDAGLRRRWQALVAHYAEWYRGRGAENAR